MRFQLLALVVGAVALAGCDSILGIQDHALGADAGASSEASASSSGAGSSSGTSSSGGKDAGSSGSDSGSSSGLDSGSSSATDAGCEVPSTQCTTGNAVQSCTASGTWGSPVACVDQTCKGGQCVGICAPGQTQCTADKTGMQSCGVDGTWGPTATCPNQTCVAGSADGGTGAAICQGVCAPQSVRCAGADGGAGGNIPQSCDGSGQWQSGTACADVCVAGQCGGNCSPGQTECGTSNDVLTCPTSGTWPTSGGTSCTSQGKACVFTGTTGNPSAACSGSCVPNVQGSCGSCGKGTETCTASGNPGTCSGDVPVTASCGVSPSCMDGTSSCGGPCVGDTTNFGDACGSCGGTVQCGGACSVATPANFGQGCGTCGGEIQCDGSCSKGSTGGTGGPADTFTLDFNTTYCHANSANFTWTPTFPGATNPSGTYTLNYTLTDHNNMSSSGTIVMYIGCSGSPTTGDGHSESAMSLGTVTGALTCPVGQSVVYYPVLCGQSGSCCGDPSVQWNITGWTSNNALCVATP